MTTIAKTAAVAGPNRAFASKPAESQEPLESFQKQPEVYLEVTPAVLFTSAFQQKLADYSAHGIPVQVSLVAHEKSATPAAPPTPATPTPASEAPAPPAPASPQIPAAPRMIDPRKKLADDVSRVSGAASGGMVGLTTSLAAAALAGAGGMLFASALHTGVGHIALGIAQHGASFLLDSKVLNTMGVVSAVVPAIATAIGGYRFGRKLGDMAGRAVGMLAGSMLGAAGYAVEALTGHRPHPVAARPDVSPSPAPKVSTVGTAFGGYLGIYGMFSGAAGGALLGTLVSNSLASGHWSALAAVVGSALVGAMGFVGGREMGQKLVGRAIAAAHP